MMTIKQIQVTVGEVCRGYVNNDELGVRGYDGRLDIRPAYQREFIYNDKEQQAVITTILNGYPLNVMYWVHRSDDADCPYEVMDGQQRTLSFCEYVAGKFSYEFKNFFNLPEDKQQLILSYPLTIYVCEGEPSEKLEWFRTINIAGKALNDQELANAVYAGPFVSPIGWARTWSTAYSTDRTFYARPCNGWPTMRTGRDTARRSSAIWHNTSTTLMPTTCGPTSRTCSTGPSPTST